MRAIEQASSNTNPNPNQSLPSQSYLGRGCHQSLRKATSNPKTNFNQRLSPHSHLGPGIGLGDTYWHHAIPFRALADGVFAVEHDLRRKNDGGTFSESNK